LWVQVNIRVHFQNLKQLRKYIRRILSMLDQLSTFCFKHYKPHSPSAPYMLTWYKCQASVGDHQIKLREVQLQLLHCRREKTSAVVVPAQIAWKYIVACDETHSEPMLLVVHIRGRTAYLGLAHRHGRRRGAPASGPWGVEASA